jgi:hypothetical protein
VSSPSLPPCDEEFDGGCAGGCGCWCFVVVVVVAGAGVTA